MNEPKIAKLLKKDLIHQQQQAYEGAHMFYYCFQPSAFLYIFSLQLYVMERAITQSSSTNLVELLLPTASTGLAVIFFFIANHYYRRCCETDISPAEKQLGLTEGNQTIHELETSRSQDESERQGELLGGNKPSKVWCQKCELLCEYRTRHCRKCRVCVERYDHHCFWLGNCVGRHNHRPFYFFLLFQTLCTSFVLVTLFQLSDKLSNIWWGLSAIRISMLILAFGFICFTGYLLIYHTMLICSGMTTWEHMRRSRIGYLKYLPPGHNPFSLGIIKNWQKFLNQKTKAVQECYLEEWGSFLPTYDEAKTLPPAFNIIQNQYYSCC